VGLLCRLCVDEIESRAEVAADLVRASLESLKENLQVCFAEIPSSDLWAQGACENCGFLPCGFLPGKFFGETRVGAVVYSFLPETARNARRPHPELIPGARDLAVHVLKAQGLIEDIEVREDAAAYPTECTYTITTLDADAVQTMLLNTNQEEHETFVCLQSTQTRLHIPLADAHFIAAKDGDKIIGAIGYHIDPFDKRIHIDQALVLEGEPQGFILANLIQAVTEQGCPEYWEVTVNCHSPRIQKTFDQLGFIPCAFFPAFGMEHGMRSDAIKMVKLTEGYEAELPELTSASKTVFELVDTIFRESSVGTAVLKLLRDLKIFRGVGEGALRRVARIFSQKLYRAGETIFEEGSAGREMYVVERGEIEIRTKDGSKLLGTIKNGAVLGEIAFLNAEPRTASAVARTSTIVRIVERNDFDKLIQRELHLGQTFFQNVALDLADKLKQSVVRASR
jgi:hypothetical protein